MEAISARHYRGKVVTLYGYNSYQDRYAGRERQLACDLPEGPTREARSDGVRATVAAPANTRTAARGSSAARQRQFDLVHVARTRPRRRAVGRCARPDRARPDADRRRARTSLPARSRPAAGGALSGNR